MLDRMGRSGGYGGHRFGWWVLVIIVGGLLGSWAGEWLGRFVPILRQAVQWGFRVDDLHLGDVFHLQLGLDLEFNLLTLVGIGLAAWLLRRT